MQNENNSSITMVPELTHFISCYQLPSRGGFFVETQLHCKKELAIFPSPAGMSLTKLSLAGKKLNYSRPGRVWSVTSRLGTGKRLTLFYSVDYGLYPCTTAPTYTLCMEESGEQCIVVLVIIVTEPASECVGVDWPAGSVTNKIIMQKRK